MGSLPAGENQVSSDAELFRALYPALRRYAAVVGSLSDDPDDLVQEAVARVLTRVSLAELDNPTAYLRRAISNLVVDNTRADIARERRHLRVAPDPRTSDPYPSDLGDLEWLAPVERAVVYLADVEGLRFGEIAVIIGITPVAARLRASRGRRRLRERIVEDS